MTSASVRSLVVGTSPPGRLQVTKKNPSTIRNVLNYALYTLTTVLDETSIEPSI